MRHSTFLIRTIDCWGLIYNTATPICQVDNAGTDAGVLTANPSINWKGAPFAPRPLGQLQIATPWPLHRISWISQATCRNLTPTLVLRLPDARCNLCVAIHTTPSTFPIFTHRTNPIRSTSSLTTPTTPSSSHVTDDDVYAPVDCLEVGNTCRHRSMRSRDEPSPLTTRITQETFFDGHPGRTRI